MSANVSIKLTLSKGPPRKKKNARTSSVMRGKKCLFDRSSVGILTLRPFKSFKTFFANLKGRNRLYKAQPTHSAILSSLPFILSAGFRWRRLAKVRHLMTPSGTIGNNTINSFHTLYFRRNKTTPSCDRRRSLM